MDYEALIDDGVKYVERVRELTAPYKVNNPAFISLLAALTYADKTGINFHHLVDRLYKQVKFRSVDKHRSDFVVFSNYLITHEPTNKPVIKVDDLIH